MYAEYFYLHFITHSTNLGIVVFVLYLYNDNLLDYTK